MTLEVEGESSLLYRFDDDSEYKRIGCIIKCGSLCESGEDSGVFHVIEHIIVNDMTKQLEKTGIIAECRGYTDFDHILICVNWREKSANNEVIIAEILKSALKLKSIDQELLAQSVKEVTDEIDEKHKQIKVQLKAWSKWTDGQIHMHPVGEALSVKKLRFDDIQVYLKKIRSSVKAYFGFNVPMMLIRDAVDNKEFSLLLQEEVFFRNINNPLFYIKDDEKARYLIGWFQERGMNEVEKAVLMNIIEKRYRIHLNDAFELFEKRIDKTCKFMYLVTESYDEYLLERITDCVIGEEVSKTELGESKTEIKRYIIEFNRQGMEENYTAIENKIVNNFLYGEEILFLNECEKLVRRVEEINLFKINEIMKELREKRINARN